MAAAGEAEGGGGGEAEGRRAGEAEGQVVQSSVVRAGGRGGLHTHCTPLLACHPLVTSVLVDRVIQAEARAPGK